MITIVTVFLEHESSGFPVAGNNHIHSSNYRMNGICNVSYFHWNTSSLIFTNVHCFINSIIQVLIFNPSEKPFLTINKRISLR